MHDAEGPVTVLDRVGEDAKRDDVVHLVDVDHLHLHLAVDREDTLHTTADLGLDALLRELLVELPAHLLDERLRGLGLLLDLLREVLVGLRLEELERELLQLFAHAADAEAMREGHEDLLRLSRFFDLLLARHVLERAHVVEAIRELDDDHADVVDHREDHLADGLGLAFGLGVVLEAGEFRDPLDELGDVLAEARFDVLAGDLRVLDGVVEQACGDRLLVEVEVGQDVGHLERVDQVGLTRASGLAPVGHGAVDVRLP